MSWRRVLSRAVGLLLVTWVLAGCAEREVDQFMSDLEGVLVGIVAGLAVLASVVLAALMAGGCWVFLGMFTATYAHLRPTRGARVVAALVGFAMGSLGLGGLVLGAMTWSSEDPEDVPSDEVWWAMRGETDDAPFDDVLALTGDAEGNLFVATDRDPPGDAHTLIVEAFGPAGERRWQVAHPLPDGRCFGTSGAASATGGPLYVSVCGRIYVLDPHDGQKLRVLDTPDASYGGLAVDADALVVLDGSRRRDALYRLSTEGEQVAAQLDVLGTPDGASPHDHDVIVRSDGALLLGSAWRSGVRLMRLAGDTYQDEGQLGSGNYLALASGAHGDVFALRDVDIEVFDLGGQRVARLAYAHTARVVDLHISDELLYLLDDGGGLWGYRLAEVMAPAGAGARVLAVSSDVDGASNVTVKALMYAGGVSFILGILNVLAALGWGRRVAAPMDPPEA